MNKIISVVLVLFFCGACASGPTMMTKKGKEVQIVHKSNVSNCDIVGKVFGKDESGSEEIAKIDLQNAASDMEVDTVVITETIQNGKVVVLHAMGYRCNQEE